MEARVKDTCRWRTVQACAGAEFVKGAWRRVPTGFEAEAQANPFLDTRETAAQVAPVAEPQVTTTEGTAVSTPPHAARKRG